MSSPDPIALVEACYDLSASQEDWLRRIAESFLPLVPEKNKGVLAYNLNFEEYGVSCTHPVQAGGVAQKTLDQVTAYSDLMRRHSQGKTSFLERIRAATLTSTARRTLRMATTGTLLSQMKKVGPDWVYTFGTPGIRDVLFLVSHHLDGLGATVVGSGLTEKGSMTTARRELIGMLSAHIKAGQRLRVRLGTPNRQIEAPEDGAVLDDSSRITHADGEARDAREILEEVARTVDRARTKAMGRDDKAVEVWTGLIDGRWSLVEQFDSDGRRYILAHRNPENVVDPRGLTNMESRVVGLAVRGYSNKLIAYHLGITEGTVSTHLHFASTKLKVKNRVELIKLLGTHYPEKTDPRFRG